jgi:regulator of nucleoside diphosphate kinase
LIASRLKLPTRDREHLEMLAQELDRAEIVRSRDIPADTVTMHSHVLVRDLDTGRESTYTLAFPSDADIAKGKISILAPIATALLGYREGDEIEWPTPGGRRRLNVIQVLYQPEAAGDEPGHNDRSQVREKMFDKTLADSFPASHPSSGTPDTAEEDSFSVVSP